MTHNHLLLYLQQETQPSNEI